MGTRRKPDCRSVLVAALLLPLAACTSLTFAERTKAGASRLYHLPYEAGTSRTVVQAGPGPFSHEGAERYAVDFAMPVGTPVLAAREGVVVAVKEDSQLGGSAREFAPHGNLVLIEHDDGTRARYLHLRFEGALVDVGQRVGRGQPIGLSGDTGWSAMPHLHFHIEARDPETGRWRSIPVAFADVRGDGVPSFLGAYRSGNGTPPDPAPSAGR